MSSNEYVCVGYVSHAHGIKGEVLIKAFTHKASWVNEKKLYPQKLYLGEKDSQADDLTLYRVQASRPHKSGLLVTFDSVQSRDDAETLKAKQVFLPKSYFTSQPGEFFYLLEIKGFQVVDSFGNNIGKITSFSSNGPQDLLVVENSEANEILIPYIDGFIKSVSFESRSITVELPEGYLEIYC